MTKSSIRPADIIAARESLGLTQTQAAALIDLKLRMWQRYESGASVMSPLMWQVWRIRAGIDHPSRILSRSSKSGSLIDDAIDAGDGTLHGAIDYWQTRALRAEAKAN